MVLTPRVLQGKVWQIRVETGDGTGGGGGSCTASGDLLALQQVETGHVLLQGAHTETAAVLAVESSLLPVGCRRLPLGGAQAAPL